MYSIKIQEKLQGKLKLLNYCGVDVNLVHIPHITLDKDEVNFWWNLETIKFDLGFCDNGTYSYYALLADGIELFGDDIDYNQKLPSEILNAIQKEQHETI
jgi:hypothetical protein